MEVSGRTARKDSPEIQEAMGELKSLIIDLGLNERQARILSQVLEHVDPAKITYDQIHDLSDYKPVFFTRDQMLPEKEGEERPFDEAYSTGKAPANVLLFAKKGPLSPDDIREVIEETQEIFRERQNFG